MYIDDVLVADKTGWHFSYGTAIYSFASQEKNIASQRSVTKLQLQLQHGKQEKGFNYVTALV